MAAALATGNRIAIDAASGLAAGVADLPASVAARVDVTAAWETDGPFAGALVEGDAEAVRAVAGRIATLAGPLVLIQSASSEELAGDPEAICLQWLTEEVSTSINTAAAGGNASLMTIA